MCLHTLYLEPINQFSFYLPPSDIKWLQSLVVVEPNLTAFNYLDLWGLNRLETFEVTMGALVKQMVPNIYPVCKSLRQLTLRHCNLWELAVQYFNGCVCLASIVLTGNKLREIPNLFHVHTTLEKLIMSTNKVVNISNLYSIFKIQGAGPAEQSYTNVPVSTLGMAETTFAATYR